MPVPPDTSTSSLQPGTHSLRYSRQPPPRIRHSRAPDALFLNHSLAIAEVYVALTEGSRHRNFGVATFATHERLGMHPRPALLFVSR